MPIYLYECKTCQKTFEHEQKITEDALTTCLCGRAEPVKRLIQPTAVMFKGSGFYVNDSASKPAAKTEAAPTAVDAAPKPETKTD